MSTTRRTYVSRPLAPLPVMASRDTVRFAPKTPLPVHLLPHWAHSPTKLLDRWVAACRQGGRLGSVFNRIGLGARLERLFAVACCRDIWSSMSDQRSRDAVDIAEGYAEGRCDLAVMVSAQRDAWEARYIDIGPRWPDNTNAATSAAAAAARCAAPIVCPSDVAIAASLEVNHSPAESWIRHGLLLVSIVGPGWTRFDPAWRTSDAVAIARLMYDSRDYSPAPILADALQDAGCNEDVLLSSLRDTAALWCRGCRVVDEILNLRS